MKPIIMIGMNPRTRHLIPWDADAQFWTMNEGPTKPWMKRYDLDFQIHQRWDWDRPNNISYPNHPLFLKAAAGPCLYCRGTGKAFKDGQPVACPWCEAGHYEIPPHRARKWIIMQDQNADVPFCVRLPIEAMTKKLCHDGEPYFTSTLAHMLGLAIYAQASDRIQLYGFECESNTEYAVQRPCIEHWAGYARGLGMTVEAPGSGLLKGDHYAYQDHKQGYRSRLELRKHELQKQLQQAEISAVKSEGILEGLTAFKDLPRIQHTWADAFDDHYMKKNFVSFLRGTLKELDRAIEILDAYHLDIDVNDAQAADMRRLIEIPYELG